MHWSCKFFSCFSRISHIVYLLTFDFCTPTDFPLLKCALVLCPLDGCPALCLAPLYVFNLLILFTSLSTTNLRSGPVRCASSPVITSALLLIIHFGSPSDVLSTFSIFFAVSSFTSPAFSFLSSFNRLQTAFDIEKLTPCIFLNANPNGLFPSKSTLRILRNGFICGFSVILY